MTKSTTVNNTAQLATFIHGAKLESILTEELAVLMSVKGTTTGADLYE
jgi:hypothetical protein